MRPVTSEAVGREQWNTKHPTWWWNEIRKREGQYQGITIWMFVLYWDLMCGDIWWHAAIIKCEEAGDFNLLHSVLRAGVIDPLLSSPDPWTCVRTAGQNTTAPATWTCGGGVMMVKSMCNEQRNWFTHWHMTHVTQCYQTLNTEQVHQGKHTMLPCLTI